MSKAEAGSELFCGIDVSAATPVAAVQRLDREEVDRREFANSAAGHRRLIAWLPRPTVSVRVSLEATGVYSMDLALALDRTEGIEVAVLNPKIANRFAQTMRRSKTDKADAAARSYALRHAGRHVAHLQLKRDLRNAQTAVSHPLPLS